MTLIRELSHVPERVHPGDFVLKLSEGVERADETVSSYVVTPQLVSAFDNALAFVKSALESRSSKAAYLHGSFGYLGRFEGAGKQSLIRHAYCDAP